MSNIDKQALRDIAEKTKIAGEAPVMPFWQRINTLNDFMKRVTPATVLTLLDELEAKDKQVAELQARDQPKFVQCWSCKRAIEVLAIADCDGYCPRCAAPIDLDDEPYAAGIGKGE
nr:ead/Ea22-like family protein [Citrobacter amalonaticus]